MNFGKRLVELRGDKTQAQVAADIGISQSAYAMYEMEKRVPSDEKKRKIAKYFGETVQNIFFN